jgi:hypothetical protein
MQGRSMRAGCRSRQAGLMAGGCLVGLAGLVAGCGSSQSAGSASHSQSPAVRKVSPATTIKISRADRKALARQYLAIARPANHRLDVEVDSYGDHERDDLRAAKKDLREQTVTERHFDAQLLQVPFPAPIEATARALVKANQVRIGLTEGQARATSLASLRSFDRLHKASDAAVETQARQIRVFLKLPPPATS